MNAISPTFISKTLYIANIEKASDFPDFCTTIAKILDREPLFEDRSLENQCKILLFKSFLDARICSIFNNHVKSSDWSIHNFGSGNKPIYDKFGKLLDTGIVLNFSQQPIMIHSEQLQNLYTEFFEKTRNHWESANPKDYPQLMFKQNKDTFYLFIKKREKSVQDELELLILLAKKFSIENDVIFSDCWLAEPNYRKGALYLWIRSSNFQSVREKLGLNLEQTDV